ncbi:hypothetical protein AMK22_31940 [Streptomyces sp. CB01580]|nr:hypothetical protein AMK22_31940 [Streptomyces sp. CB01580]
MAMTGTVPVKPRQPSSSVSLGDQPCGFCQRGCQQVRDGSRMVLMRFIRACAPASFVKTRATGGKPPRPESSHNVDHNATSPPSWSLACRPKKRRYQSIFAATTALGSVWLSTSTNNTGT